LYTYAAEYTGGHFDEIKSDKGENGHRKGCPKRHSFPQTKRKVHHELNLLLPTKVFAKAWQTED